MTVKEYLTQAYRIDQRINSKLEQIASLRGLALKATATLSGLQEYLRSDGFRLCGLRVPR